MSSYATRRLTRKRNKELTATKKALECANADLTARDNTITNLRDDAKERAAELSRALATITEQAAVIATFKEEHLTLMLEVAEMRGYINRVLEDDHVREFGPAQMGEQVMDDKERQHLMQVMAQDAKQRRQPPRPVRQGPCRAPVLASAAYGCDDFDLRAGSVMQRTSPRPKHWTAR